MDWSDEHYVKLFTRDTVTWKSWPWQARALLPLMLRKVDNTGFFDVGKREPARTLAVMVEVPEEVVAPGLAAMVESGTVELVGGKLLLVNFVEAQESRKTDKAKARDYRNRKRDHERSNFAKSQEQAVTRRHPPSPDVTAGYPPALLCPSPALPVPLLPPKQPAAKQKTLPIEEPPDPRHAPLVKALVDTYVREKRTQGYPGFNGKHAKLVQRLLAAKPAAHPPETWPAALVAGWEKALADRYPECATLEDFEKKLAKYIGTGPGPPSRGPRDLPPEPEGDARL